MGAEDPVGAASSEAADPSDPEGEIAMAGGSSMVRDASGEGEPDNDDLEEPGAADLMGAT